MEPNQIHTETIHRSACVTTKIHLLTKPKTTSVVFHQGHPCRFFYFFLTWPIIGTSPGTCGDRRFLHASLHQPSGTYGAADSESTWRCAPQTLSEFLMLDAALTRQKDIFTVSASVQTRTPAPPPPPPRKERRLLHEGWEWRGRRRGRCLHPTGMLSSKERGRRRGEGAALCYYVSEHHRSTLDLSASGTRGDSLHSPGT